MAAGRMVGGAQNLRCIGEALAVVHTGVLCPNVALPGDRSASLLVLTWNLWGRFGDWHARHRAIAATLRSSSADVIAVQESWTMRDHHQVELLGEQLGLHYFYEADVGFGSGESGNGILSRWPIRRASARRLYGTSDSDGGFAVHAEVAGPRGRVHVFSVILDSGAARGRARQLEVGELVSWIDEVSGDGLVLVCGDLNAAPNSAEIRMLVQSSDCGSRPNFVDAWQQAGGPGPGYTWSRNNPITPPGPPTDRRIDYVMSARPHPDAAGKPLHCGLTGVEPVDGVQPSDHYAVLAEVTY